MSKILVTGGAGYIGSFMVKRLLEDGDDVVVVDNFEKGHKEAIDKNAEILEGNLLNKSFVKNLFSGNKFDSIIHFAGYISMAESMESPAIYFDNNVYTTVNLLEEMRNNQVNNFIFSSTAGVYGNPIKIPISEDHPKNPTNPYGESKLMVEKILQWYQKIYNINFTALRYFNAAGASLDGTMGEAHLPETHIIPNAIRAALNDLEFTLYGSDYNTPDGTCVRDYIHVLDLVDAHVLALRKISSENGGFVYNVGTGNGYTNKEVLNMVKNVSGIDFKINISGKRPGDAEALVADATSIKKELGFNPKYSDLKTIIETAWKWHEKNQKSKIKNQK